MKFIIDKRNYIILILIILLCLGLLVIKNNRVFLKSFNFNDKVITIAIYDKINVKKISKEINDIYNKNKNIQDINELGIDNELVNDVDKESVIFSFTNDEVIDYLKKSKIKKYIINADGDIITGNKYGESKYNISINDQKNNKVLKIVSLENDSMVTVNDGDYDSLVVIGDNLINTNITAQFIKNLSVDEGTDFALKNNCEVLWYFDNEILMTDNFAKYII